MPTHKRWPIPDIPYGLVLITKGVHAGRIGDFDDDGDDLFRGIVYFGGMLRARGHYLIDKRYFREPSVNDLVLRYRAIATDVFDTLKLNTPTAGDYRRLCSLMAEQHSIYTELEWRNLVGRFGKSRKGRQIYLAHSTKDKGLVRMVHDDLKNFGHAPWLDEYAISVGESIIKKLEEGITECEYMIVFLSKNSENSEWVRVEWESKFLAEIRKQRISVLPALLGDCTIPPMLARLKYADFRQSYNDGLEQIGHRPSAKKNGTRTGKTKIRGRRRTGSRKRVSNAVVASNVLSGIQQWPNLPQPSRQQNRERGLPGPTPRKRCARLFAGRVTSRPVRGSPALRPASPAPMKNGLPATEKIRQII